MENPFKSAVEGIRSGMMTEPGVVDKIFDKPIELIHEDPNNPRSIDNKGYAEESLKDLAEDIKVNGVINAIVVREHPTIRGEWQIVSGHRRFRAAQMAGLKSVPVRISKNQDYRAEQIAENLHREDLTLTEMSSIISEFVKQGLSSYEISEKLHKSQAFVAQHMRLLKAPTCVQTMINQGLIKNSMQGSELCRAYKDDPEQTEAVCKMWELDKIEPTLGMIKQFRSTLKNNIQRDSHFEESEKEALAKSEKAELEDKPTETKTKHGKMLRRFVQIRAKFKGMDGLISLDRTPTEEGKVWFIPEGSSVKDAYEVQCSDIQMLSIAENH